MAEVAAITARRLRRAAEEADDMAKRTDRSVKRKAAAALRQRSWTNGGEFCADHGCPRRWCSARVLAYVGVMIWTRSLDC